MKIFFASDIHGSLYYTKKMLALFEEEKADVLVLLGDFLYHGARNDLPKDYNTKEVINLLNKYSSKIIAIQGNCDSEVDQMVLDFELAKDTYLLIDNQRFYLTHGHVFNEHNMPKLQPNDIMVYGHFHIPMYKMVKDVLVLSPGSVAIPKEWSTYTYILYEDGQIIFKDFDKNDITNKVKEKSKN